MIGDMLRRAQPSNRCVCELCCSHASSDLRARSKSPLRRANCARRMARTSLSSICSYCLSASSYLPQRSYTAPMQRLQRATSSGELHKVGVFLNIAFCLSGVRKKKTIHRLA